MRCAKCREHEVKLIIIDRKHPAWGVGTLVLCPCCSFKTCPHEYDLTGITGHK